MRRRKTAYSIILAAVLASSSPAALACYGEGCGDDFGQYREERLRQQERQRFTQPEANQPGYNRSDELRRHFDVEPPAYTPPRRGDSSSPYMWNQFGPDGKFQTCQRGFDTVYCF